MMFALEFASAERLLLLAVVAALAAVYVVLHLRRPKYAVRFTNLALLEVVAPKRPQWRRHVPAAAMLAALAALVVALAHPTRTERVPVERATVMLALDVSLSMEATDVEPSRLEAAKAAALAFAEDAPPQVRIGLVTFARTASVRVSPTLDRVQLANAISTMQLAPGTAIGEAIFSSLAAIEADLAADQAGARAGDRAGDRAGANGSAPSTTAPATTAPASTVPDKPKAAAIVVMSDGYTNSGRANDEAAAAAGAAGIPVTTIAYGTAEGTIDVNGEPQPVPVEGPALRSIADETGGSFFEAATGSELAEVLKDIGSRVGGEPRRRDVSGWFVGFGFVALLAAAGASLAWFSRLP